MDSINSAGGDRGFFFVLSRSPTETFRDISRLFIVDINMRKVLISWAFGGELLRVFQLRN